MSSGAEEVQSVAKKRTLSCTACFDALWFCYSPVHQLKQYYRLGSLENCGGKWKALMSCLTLKTKSSAELPNILEAREQEKAKLHIWTFRAPEEASSVWMKKYGYFGYTMKGKKGKKEKKRKNK